ncbi:LCP family protein [Nocardia sp. NEAU-G5]|uniref:LCP family protein n=1 Tax=Nocardia albiluteola TaxID=2842303 RepID=A0ABS6B0T4_9NOCA|nr:LCP family protein [Nocardia albiluteola]MBU3063903.1 LCP family protein [Nocardia albiluteola]
MSGDWSGRGGQGPQRPVNPGNQPPRRPQHPPAGQGYPPPENMRLRRPVNPGNQPPRRPTEPPPGYGSRPPQDPRARRPMNPGGPPPRRPQRPPTAPRRPSPRRWWRNIRRVLVLLVVLVLALVGYYTYLFASMSGTMASSHALDGAPTSSSGTNILLMGLDTRNDQNGQALPPAILSQLHAGDGEEGGYNTNTLILIHVPSGGGKAQAFSIPRDDGVQVPGYGMLKIKEAYGNAKAAAEQTAAKQGVTDQHQLETIGREAGRKLELETVRNLTGVSIDHFAEVSLAGFYDLANALGGVKVCLNNAVNDSAYSGAVFPAGVQNLNGAQSLAFVRQRHGLPNGDLDRTHRQQAFLASASHNIRSAGTILDPFKMSDMTNAAKRDVVIDSRWNAFSMALQLRSLTGGNMVFQTLPIEDFFTLNGESANEIDPAKIREIIQSTFYGTNTSAAGGTNSPGDGSGPTAPTQPSAPGPSGPAVQANSDGGVPCVN